MLRYVVRAELPDSETGTEYSSWLRAGHIDEVCRVSGATAEIVELGTDHAIIEVHYLFPSQAAFETYERDHAPLLRAEGMARFGDRARFSRRLEPIGT